MREILLTAPQADAARWALGGMESLSDQEFDELGFTHEDLPRLEGRTLAFRDGSGPVAAAGDMAYRVSLQLDDMSAAEVAGDVRNVAGNKLAAKLRKAFPTIASSW